MVVDAFTQIVFGSIGFHLKNDAYAQLVSVFQVFESVGVLAESGGYASITNSATNFGFEGLKAVGFSENVLPILLVVKYQVSKILQKQILILLPVALFLAHFLPNQVALQLEQLSKFLLLILVSLREVKLSLFQITLQIQTSMALAK